MSKRLNRPLIAAALSLLILGPGRAALAVPAVQLFEYPTDPIQPGDPAHVGYSLLNNPANTFDIVALAVSIPQDPIYPPDPVAPAGWTAQALTAADWGLPMGGEFLTPPGGSVLVLNPNPSWQQLTGKSFDEVFTPTDPCVGYFVEPVFFNADTFHFTPGDPCIPGNPVLPGFTRAGLPGSTFIVAGPSDVTTFEGNTGDNPIAGIQTFVGQANTGTPEPASLGAAALAATALAATRRSRR